MPSTICKNSLQTLRCLLRVAISLGFVAADAFMPMWDHDANASPVPVVYGTDLFHPYDDPDDHYDLATLFALPDVEIRAILLDLGDRQKERPGTIPLRQMFKITGRTVPYATGLSAPLESEDDAALTRPRSELAAVDLLLDVLRRSPTPVNIVTAGSLRDVAIAFNREPQLLRDKVAKLYINIGSAIDRQEWNVGLDVHAYLAILRSGLPVYLCPCEPLAPHEHSTYWKFRQSEVFEGLSRPTLNWLIYGLQRVDPVRLAPDAVLTDDLSAWQELPGRLERNMWCTASLLDVAEKTAVLHNGRFIVGNKPAQEKGRLFEFIPARVEVDEQGRTKSIAMDPQSKIHLFHTSKPHRYAEAMRDCLHELLKSLGREESRPE
ncbi:MAG: nucleoside hydrolase [Planctomycetales bacterium]|nr:nucleoside hydrolase [Planctomycetales bacterium]